MTNVLRWIFAAVLGYLIGSFPTAVLLGRIMHGVDIRGRGSGNPGTANALRVLGPAPAALVFAGDLGKGAIAAYLPALFLGPDGGWLGGLAAVIGHVFPLYAGFRGGKGLATGLGVVLLRASWLVPVFAVCWLPLYLWRRSVALASAGAILAVALAGFFALAPWPALIVAAGAVLIFFRHWPEAARAFTR